MAYTTQDNYSTQDNTKGSLTDTQIAQTVLKLLRGTSRAPSGAYSVHLFAEGRKTKSPRCGTLEEAWDIAADFYAVNGIQRKASALRWAATVIAIPEVSQSCRYDIACEMLEEVIGLEPEQIDSELIEHLESSLGEFIDTHPPLNTEPHEALPKAPKVDRGHGSKDELRVLECALCSTQFTHPRIVGRPPAYCSSACRSQVARICTSAWKVVNNHGLA